MTRSNDAYAWGGHYNVDRSYGTNGLNQLTSAGATSLGYDARGNLTSAGSDSYGYSSENRMTSGPGGAALSDDPLGRLYQLSKAGTTTRFQYDGSDLIAEYDGSTNVLRRYVHGPGADNPIVWYEGSGISGTTRRFLMADERGSIVSVTDSANATIGLNAYDDHGVPAAGNIGRFGYTGQAWLSEVGIWYYKARMYSPTLGRFMQTDPIGYADGMNWYNYVGGDPLNRIDPTGLGEICNEGGTCQDDGFKDILVQAGHLPSGGANIGARGGQGPTIGSGDGGSGSGVICTGYACINPTPPPPPLPCEGLLCKPKPPKPRVLPDCSTVSIPGACRSTAPKKHWHDDIDWCRVASKVGVASAYATVAGQVVSKIPYPVAVVGGNVVSGVAGAAGTISAIGSHLAGCP